MRAVAAAAGLMLLAGLLALGFAASRGEATVVLILVFPAVVGWGPWAAAGMLLTFAGAALGLGLLAGRRLQGGPWVASSYVAGDEVRTEAWTPTPADGPREPAEGEPRRRAGGFLLLGPIPIAFGSTRGLAWAMMALALAVVLLLLLVPWLLGVGS